MIAAKIGQIKSNVFHSSGNPIFFQFAAHLFHENMLYSNAAQLNNSINHVMHSSSCLHPSSITPLCLSPPLSVWQGRGQRAAGRVSRWAVSGGGVSRDAFAALCFQGHKPPWVVFYIYVLEVLGSSLLAVVNCVYNLKQHVDVWVGRVSVKKLLT